MWQTSRNEQLNFGNEGQVQNRILQHKVCQQQMFACHYVIIHCGIIITNQAQCQFNFGNANYYGVT